jgi:hypothetical protein
MSETLAGYDGPLAVALGGAADPPVLNLAVP